MNFAIIFVCWLAFGLVGSLALYVGYGFAMSAKRARDAGVSQRKVVVVDGCLALPFILLDALLNVFFYSIITLDFRPEYTLNLVTGRLCRYNADPNERHFRRCIADAAAAFLDGKDPSGDHIKGFNIHLNWLD